MNPILIFCLHIDKLRVTTTTTINDSATLFFTSEMAFNEFRRLQGFRNLSNNLSSIKPGHVPVTQDLLRYKQGGSRVFNLYKRQH